MGEPNTFWKEMRPHMVAGLFWYLMGLVTLEGIKSTFHSLQSNIGTISTLLVDLAALLLIYAAGLYCVKLWSLGRSAPASLPTSSELTEEQIESIAYQNKLIELGRSVDGVLRPLQIDALQLSTNLLEFIKQLCVPPTPKYSRKQYERMPSEEMRKLINAQDGDWIEASIYYGAGNFTLTAQAYEKEMVARWTRLFPWYEKVRARYALEFKEKVDKLNNRLAVEGIRDDSFSLPVADRDGVNNIRVIASKLWESAYAVAEKTTE